jgi:RNA polymerase sigma-32 factor
MEELALRKEFIEGVEDSPFDQNIAENSEPLASKEKPGGPYDLLRVYLLEVAQYDMLTREEEIRLAIRAQEEHDEEAVERLVTSNLRLVVKIATDFHLFWSRYPLDLVQEGNLGLLQAVKKFDPHRGIKFSFYAAYWIKAYMLKFIMDNWKLVKIGTTQSQRRLFFNLAKEKEKLKAEGLTSEPKLLAERLNVKETEVIEMSQRLGGSELSFDYPVGEDSSEPYSSFLPDSGLAVDEQISEWERKKVFGEKLKSFREGLSARDGDIFDNRIMAEKPLILKELGNKYQISRERVRQIQKGIVKRIKEWSKKEIPNFDEEYADLLR